MLEHVHSRNITLPLKCWIIRSSTIYSLIWRSILVLVRHSLVFWQKACTLHQNISVATATSMHAHMLLHCICGWILRPMIRLQYYFCNFRYHYSYVPLIDTVICLLVSGHEPCKWLWKLPGILFHLLKVQHTVLKAGHSMTILLQHHIVYARLNNEYNAHQVIASYYTYKMKVYSSLDNI